MLLSDGELLRLIAHHNQDALSELYRRYCNLVYSLAFHTLQNADWAEEVTQDVFIKIWTQPDRWNPTGGKFSSWLLTVTRYTAIDRLRKEQHHSSREVQLPESIPCEIEDGFLGDELGKDFRMLMDQLPTNQAQVIQLAFFRGMTHKQMASALDLPIGTVKTRLRLGLSKLKHSVTESFRLKIN
ncbi:MAG: sigma-70 family RNA polymerase sigma factor [Chloroflexota bacterium]